MIPAPRSAKENAAPAGTGNGIDFQNSTTETYPSATQNARASGRRARIQSALHAAHELGQITDAVHATGAMMANYIKDDFAQPICAVEVQRMARDRGRDVSTIRKHIYALKRARLVEDRTAGNGWRGVCCAGEMVLGVCFDLALSRLDDLRRAVMEKRKEEGRILGLRRVAKALRHRLRAACEEMQDMGVLEWLSTLPRRYQGLSAGELAEFVIECERHLAALVEARQKEMAAPREPNYGKTTENSAIGRAKMHDAPCEIARHTDTKSENNNRKCTGPAADNRAGYVHATTPQASNENKLTPSIVLAALPPEWREWLTVYQEAGMDEARAFALVAKQHFNRMGGSEKAWMIAKSRVGEPLAALLVLIAGTSEVRSMDAWLLAMVKRAEKHGINWITPLKRLANAARLKPEAVS